MQRQIQIPSSRPETSWSGLEHASLCALGLDAGEGHSIGVLRVTPLPFLINACFLAGLLTLVPDRSLPLGCDEDTCLLPLVADRSLVFGCEEDIYFVSVETDRVLHPLRKRPRGTTEVTRAHAHTLELMSRHAHRRAKWNRTLQSDIVIANAAIGHCERSYQYTEQ